MYRIRGRPKKVWIDGVKNDIVCRKCVNTEMTPDVESKRRKYILF